MQGYKIVGFITLALALLVVILSAACMGVAEVFISYDASGLAATIDEMAECERQVAFQIPNLCNSTTPSCGIVNASATNSDETTVCGFEAGCACLNSGVSLNGNGNWRLLLTIGITTMKWICVAAGICALIGIAPVILGAIGKVLDVEVLSITCGVTGIVIEACFGLIATGSLALASYFVGAIVQVLAAFFSQHVDTSTNITAVDQLFSHPNVCPSACQAGLSGLGDDLHKLADNMTTASHLAVAAAVFSVLSLIFTCVGFFLHKSASSSTTTTTTTTTLKGGYGSM